MISQSLLAGALSLFLSPTISVAAMDKVGQSIGEVELADFALSAADSFEDYQGRAVLLEFFAYW